jgi:hypothetical protein
VLAVVSALLGSAITGAVTYFVTSRSIRAAKEDAKDQRAHDREMARRDLEQRRRELAYLDMLVAIRRGVMTAMQTRPVAGGGRPLDLPQQLSLDEWAVLDARVTAFGSRDVDQAYSRWWGHFNRW